MRLLLFYTSKLLLYVPLTLTRLGFLRLLWIGVSLSPLINFLFKFSGNILWSIFERSKKKCEYILDSRCQQVGMHIFVKYSAYRIFPLVMPNLISNYIGTHFIDYYIFSYLYFPGIDIPNNDDNVYFSKLYYILINRLIWTGIIPDTLIDMKCILIYRGNISIFCGILRFE